jgi:large subunit ribosomal protein L7Ae
MPKKVVKKTVTSSGAKGSAGGSLFTKSTRNFRIGGDIQPIRDLTRFVKWPKYIRIQRQKRIMFLRLKSPPAIAQFQSTIDKNQAASLLKLLAKYSPEDKKEKKTRLQTEAEARKGGAKGNIGPKPNHLKYGLNHVTNLVEEGKAKLVVMSHDVDPMELMVYLPALCRKKNIPFCFIKSKARLGKLCHAKTATCVALTDVRKEDLTDFNNLQNTFRAQFNDNSNLRRHWGGGVMGIKNQHMMAKRQKLAEIEEAKKANM